jgi:tRNA pseudouridine55 synthase
VVLVEKPIGPTSHDLVDRVRRTLHTQRVGHLGTLDPFASGLLVVVVGRATRLAGFTGGWTKDYEGVIRLGTRTATDDLTGDVVDVSEAWREFEPEQVEAALLRFRGAYDQQPPAFSAVHVGGERAYRRARRGETVALAPRRVEVSALELTHCALPDVGFRATVTGGTYLRGLARDLGTSLACGAHLAALRRLRVGPFWVRDAVSPESAADALRPPDALVADLPRRELEAAEAEAVVHGRPIPAPPEGGGDDGARFALFAAGRLLAIAERVGGVIKPRVVLE